VYGLASGFQTTAEGVHAWAFALSLATMAITLISYAAFLPSARRLFASPRRRQRNRTIAMAALLLSMLCFFAAGLAGGAAVSVAMAVAAVLSGFGTAVLLMSFGVSFSICDIATITVSTAISLIVSMGISTVVMLIDQYVPALATLLCFCLPVAEFLCLQRCSAQLVDGLQFSTSTIPVKNFSFGCMLGIPAFILGLAIGLIRTKCMLSIYENQVYNDQALTFILAGIFACTVIVLAMLTQRQTDFFIFRTMMPVVAIFVGVILTPLSENTTFSVFCMFFSYLIMEACMWITFADISQKYRVSAFVVFGFGRGFLALGTLAIYLITVLGSPLNNILVDDKLFAVALLALLLIGQSTLPNNQEIRSKLLRGHSCPALMNDAEFEKFFEMPEVELAPGVENMANVSLAADAADGNVEAPDTQADVDAQKEAAHGQNHTQDDTHMSAQAEANASTVAPQNAEGEPTGGVEATEPKATQVTPSPTPAPTPAPAPAKAAAEAADAPEEERLGWFKKKCLAVADAYLLSKRETEVLFLLAKGHNSAAIQKALFISAGTANTHMRHVYAKLDVHSQQELISLVESVEL
jgi:DNA-binding CsgD family transcriptional regulator